MPDEKVAKYQNAVIAAGSCAKVLSAHDLPGLLAAIERIDAFGSIFDPTLYRERSQAMLEDKELLEAALPLWRFAKKFAAAAAPPAEVPGG